MAAGLETAESERSAERATGRFRVSAPIPERRGTGLSSLYPRCVSRRYFSASGNLGPRDKPGDDEWGGTTVWG